MILGPRERVLTPRDEHRFTDACFALSSGTRLAVLEVLLRAREPLHIREVARRVGLDPSPVRTHLDVLARSGYARELADPGRERRFVADVSEVRLVQTPPERPVEVPNEVEPSKPIRKITDKMRSLEDKLHRLERELADLADERGALWREAMADHQRQPPR